MVGFSPVVTSGQPSLAPRNLVFCMKSSSQSWTVGVESVNLTSACFCIVDVSSDGPFAPRGGDLCGS